MSSIYFLKCLGFDDIYKRNDKLLKIAHEVVNKEVQEYLNCYWDDFGCEIANLTGLKMEGDSGNKIIINSRASTMSLLLRCVESLVKLKVALSSDLLILCCIYANYCQNNNFFNVLKSNIMQCLDGNDDNYKERNYQWFKMYILNSNLWLVEVPQKEKNSNDVERKTPTPDDTNDCTILFDTIVVDVNKLLMKQKEFIWDNVKKIQNTKETNVIFEKLCNFGVNNSRNKTDLRQDRIKNGIVSNVNERELIIQKYEMGISAHSRFDLKYEMNSKTYLTQCLVFAHTNNNRLQSEMKEYFSDKLGVKCKYQSAPVKLSNRCVVKATSDYGKKGRFSSLCTKL